MSRTAARAIAAILLTVATMLAGATPALAHTSLVSSDPANGAVIQAAPVTLTLTFTDSMQADFSTVTVTGQDGAGATVEELRSDGDAVVVTVAPLTRSGRYDVGYRVLSQDGHPVTGTVAFTLQLPAQSGAAAPPSPTGAAAAPTVTPPPSESAAPAGAGTPVWPWLVAALVLVGGGVGAALRLGRGQ